MGESICLRSDVWSIKRKILCLLEDYWEEMAGTYYPIHPIFFPNHLTKGTNKTLDYFGD